MARKKGEPSYDLAPVLGLADAVGIAMARCPKTFELPQCDLSRNLWGLILPRSRLKPTWCAKVQDY